MKLTPYKTAGKKLNYGLLAMSKFDPDMNDD